MSSRDPDAPRRPPRAADTDARADADAADAAADAAAATAARADAVAAADAAAADARAAAAVRADAVARPFARSDDEHDPDAAAILARRRAFVVTALAGLGAAATAPLDALADGPGEPVDGAAGGLIAQPRPCLRVAPPRPCLQISPPHPCLTVPISRVGTLRVTSTPPGAVTIDGLARGTTPLVVQLPVGAHVVVVTDPASGASRTMHVDIALGQTKTIVVRLTP